MLNESGISNVTYLFFAEKDCDEEGDSSYVKVVERFQKNSIDFVLIDGIYRSACANAVLEYIRPGGVLIIDNANWCLPSDSVSPNSRTFDEGPASLKWAEFACKTKDWRCIWTSSGVSDTALYIKCY